MAGSCRSPGSKTAASCRQHPEGGLRTGALLAALRQPRRWPPHQRPGSVCLQAGKHRGLAGTDNPSAGAAVWTPHRQREAPPPQRARRRARYLASARPGQRAGGQAGASAPDRRQCGSGGTPRAVPDIWETPPPPPNAVPGTRAGVPTS